MLCTLGPAGCSPLPSPSQHKSVPLSRSDQCASKNDIHIRGHASAMQQPNNRPNSCSNCVRACVRGCSILFRGASHAKKPTDRMGSRRRRCSGRSVAAACPYVPAFSAPVPVTRRWQRHPGVCPSPCVHLSAVQAVSYSVPGSCWLTLLVGSLTGSTATVRSARRLHCSTAPAATTTTTTRRGRSPSSGPPRCKASAGRQVRPRASAGGCARAVGVDPNPTRRGGFSL